MATITLVANTNYSAIAGMVNGDTIALAGFRLTIDAQPTHTGIFVTSAGTAGAVVINSSYNISTWTFTAGSAVMIATVPSGCTIGTVNGGASAVATVTTNSGTITNANGGSVASSHGVTTNNGTVTTSTGGSALNTFGVNTNGSAGSVTNANGGTAVNAFGVSSNLGTITNVTGGAADTARGVSTNAGTITNVTGGSAANAAGVLTNNGTIINATGGSVSSAYGVATNNGLVLNMTNAVGVAVFTWTGTVTFVFGPGVRGTIASPITTIYSFGAMNPAATLPIGATVVTLIEGGGNLINNQSLVRGIVI